MSCLGKCVQYYRDYRNNRSLQQCTKDTVSLFSFENYTCKVNIVDVYDGDTFTGCFYYNNKLYKYKFRTIGYDSPEMKPLKINKNRDKEKQAAKRAKERFIELIDNKLVTVEMGKFDKYGRILATVYHTRRNNTINNIMIREGHGVPYTGGTKQAFQIT
jgi:endonuclease YncB( thermonuclease family)